MTMIRNLHFCCIFAYFFGSPSAVSQSDFYNKQFYGYFNGSSHLEFHDSSHLLQNGFSLSFLTCENSSILFQQINQFHDFFNVKRVDRQLHVEIHFASTNQSVTFVDEKYVNQNVWTHIMFEGSNIKTFLNGKKTILAKYPTNLRLDIVKFFRSSQIFIGNDKGGANGFVGCLQFRPNVYLNESEVVAKAVEWNSCPPNIQQCPGTEPNACSSQPCQNEGLCLPINSTNKDYACICPSDTAGKNCEVAIDTEKGIEVGFMQNHSSTTQYCNISMDDCGNGTCVTVGASNWTACQCNQEHYGRNCALNGTNPCFSLPCQHNATCMSDDYGNFTCFCQAGFMGAFCELEADRCLSLPCLNGGVCENLEDDYACLCEGTNFEGRNCDIDVNECLGDPCIANATCYNSPGSYTCVCADGYEGDFCNVSSDICLLQPCENIGRCISGNEGFFQCECARGFTGFYCEEEIDYCVGNQCDPHSETCISEPGRHYCVCRRGFGGANCEELDECLSNPCKNNATCVNQIDAFYCNCLLGYKGIYCQIEIDECAPNPCQNNASCSDLVGDYFCECLLGWTGKNCSEEFNPCESNPCKNGATCSVLLHTESPPYTCTCVDGFAGYQCQTNIDDCVNVTCAYNEECVDDVDFYSCECNRGYTRDGNGTCNIDINECVSEPCQNNATCTDLIDRFECECAFGYEGEVCETVTNFCKSGPCLNNGICQPTFGSFSCFCKSGWVGVLCEFSFDHCFSDPCLQGDCQSVGDQYTCDCFSGYNGTNCEHEINECLSDPCQNNATCHDLIGKFNCSCPEGWQGDVCDVNINECLSEPCENGGICLDLISGYNCSCALGFTGVHCEVDIDECDSSPCLNGGECLNELASFRCVCDGTGFTGVICENEIDECQTEAKCQNGAHCIDERNNYTCQCLPGYIGRHCEVDVDECLSNPCLNNGTCMEFSNMTLYPSYFPTNFTFENAQGYDCHCYPGYEGAHCEIETDECELLKPCQNNASCTDLINDHSCECVGFYGGKNCSISLQGCEKGHSCLHGATCIPYLEDEMTDLHNYTCDCETGFMGQFCESPTSATFSASKSRAVFLVQPNISHKFSFAFRTTLPHGIITTFSFGNDLLQIFLDNGVLHYSIDSNIIAIENSSKNDGAWHSFQVKFNFMENETTVLNFMENETTVLHSENDENINLNVSTRSDIDQKIIVAFGSNNSSSSFVGCIRDLFFENRLHTFKESHSLYNVIEGCERFDVCSNTTCGEKGKCIDLWNKASCQCVRPYIGTNCSEERTPATFGYKDASSFAVFELPFIPGSRFNISLFLLTRQADGIIVQTVSSVNETDTNSDIAIVLSEGYMQVAVGSETHVFTSLPRLNDGIYHFVNVTVVENRLTANIDSENSIEEFLDNPINITTRRITFGRASESIERRRKRETFRGFKGALQDIFVADVLLVFYPDEDEADDSLLRRTRVYPVSSYNLQRGELPDPMCGEPESISFKSPCRNNGSCVSSFNDYTCACPEEWTGKNCDQPVYCKQLSCPAPLSCVDLPNGGFECVGPTTLNDWFQVIFFLYNDNGEATLNNSIQFKIRTRSLSSEFFHIVSASENSMRLNLDQLGRVRLHLKLSNFTTFLTSETSVNDGEWHLVYATQNNRNVTLTVDNFTSNALNLPTSSILQEILSSPHSNIMLGEFTENDTFKGCIDEIRIGGYLLPFYNPYMLTNLTIHPSISSPFELITNNLLLGCHSDDKCNGLENPCQNGGTCVDDFYRFNCRCPRGFTGELCEINKNDCWNITCSNSGNCTDLVDGFECHCDVGYQGELCEVDIDECHSSPCFHNGTCLDLIDSFTCDCSGTNFIGNLCEVNATNACGKLNNQNAPCQNNGTCTNITTNDRISFNCSCPSLFYGEKCEYETDLCENVTCLNGGICVSNKTSFATRCECTRGFVGETCSRQVQVCTEETCLNNATCVDTKDGYQCKCPDGLIGKNCEKADLCLARNNSSTYCTNGGTCFYKLEPHIFFSCLCSPAHTGPRCTFSNPCYNDTCLNGGRCHVGWPKPPQVSTSINTDPITVEPMMKCECFENYSGDKCEKSNSSSQSTVILASSIGGVILFLLLISYLSYLLATAFERRANSGTYSPSTQEALGTRPGAGSDFMGMEMWSELKPPPKCERLI